MVFDLKKMQDVFGGSTVCQTLSLSSVSVHLVFKVTEYAVCIISSIKQMKGLKLRDVKQLGVYKEWNKQASASIVR